MKRISLLAVMLSFLAASFISCGGDSESASGDAYKMTNLPEKFSAKIPASISGSSQIFGSPKKPGSPAKIIFKDDAEDTSQGCTQMKYMTTMMKSFGSMIPMMAIIADAAIAQGGLTADEQAHTVPVTFTRGMYDSMISLADGFDIDASEMESAIGETQNVSVKFSDTGFSPYDYSVEFKFEDEVTPATIFWSSDKKNTKLILPCFSEETDESGNVTETRDGDLIFTYEDNAKLMTMIMSMSGYKSEMSLEEKGAGALFYCSTKSTSSYTDYNTGEKVTQTSTYRMEGYADDNGGYVKTTFVSGLSSNTVSETFDASGKLLTGNTDYSDTYGDNADEVGDLTTNVGFTTTTTAADGEYLVMSSNSYAGGAVPSDEATLNQAVGYGIVISGTLVIQDLGAPAFSVLETSGKVYIYKVAEGFSFFSDTSPEFTTTPIEVSYTL